MNTDFSGGPIFTVATASETEIKWLCDESIGNSFDSWETVWVIFEAKCQKSFF